MKSSVLAWIAVIGVFIGVIVLAVNLADTTPRASNSPLLNLAAPPIELERLDDGGTVRLSDYEGQIVVVNFFASWCLQCVQEHPDLIAAANTLDDRGVQFLGVTYQDRPADSLAFLEERGRGDTYEYVHDADGFTAIKYGLFGIPETFFIDGDGVVRAKITGTANLPLILSIVEDIEAGNTTGVTETGETQSSRDG